jgi:hypothetical protein
MDAVVLFDSQTEETTADPILRERPRREFCEAQAFVDVCELTEWLESRIPSPLVKPGE